MLPVLRRGTTFPSFMDDFLGRDFFSNFFDNQTGMSIPSVNIIEGKEDFRIEVAVPGLDKKDFKIDLNNNVLVISSEKEVKNEQTDEKYMRKEFSYSSFQRSFTLPNSVDAEKINAAYKDGVLNVTIPKKEDAKEKPPRTIKIA
ncbi:MAG: Hsp20/alpha crystallin family protein [Bacteroidales bacterium]|jgi:HSP20 family protein|nr:Hsp20/alpha crystallin family protein [Bacteroidales bacterium]